MVDVAQELLERQAESTRHNNHSLHRQLQVQLHMSALRIHCPPDLPLPHGLAPSETMVSIPLRAQKTLEIKGFLGLERPFLGFGLADPAPKG